MNGRFFVLEGIDGSGKSTQLRLLAQRVQAAGIITRNTRDFKESRVPAFTPAEYLA